MEGIEKCPFCGIVPQPDSRGFLIHPAGKCIMSSICIPISDWQTRHPLQSGLQPLDEEAVKQYLYAHSNGIYTMDNAKDVAKTICAKFGSGQAGVGLDEESVFQAIKHVELYWAVNNLDNFKREIAKVICSKFTKPQGKVPSVLEIMEEIKPYCGLTERRDKIAKVIHNLLKASQ